MKYTKLYQIAEKLAEKGLAPEIRINRYKHTPCAVWVDHDYYGTLPDAEAWKKMDTIDAVCKKYKGITTERRGYYQSTLIYLKEDSENNG